MAAESLLEKSIIRHARANRIYTRKFTSPSHAGVPDRLFCYGGGVLFLEVKARGKRPTDLQKDELEELMRAGIPATWVDNLEDAKGFLAELMDHSTHTLWSSCERHNALL